MSSERDRVRELAERVARKIADAPEPGGARADGGDLDSLRSALAEIQRRLAHVESHLAGGEGHEHGARGGSGKPGGAAPANPANVVRQTPGARAASPARSTLLSGTYVPAVSHPSQERFANVGEAVSELVEFFEGEKTCAIEPGAKPCDECGLCSSRGF